MQLKLYRKKPVVIEAVHWTPGEGPELLMNWMTECGVKTYYEPLNKWIVIPTLAGDMRLLPSEYLIRGVQGEFYPCKPDIFEVTYEPA